VQPDGVRELLTHFGSDWWILYIPRLGFGRAGRRDGSTTAHSVSQLDERLCIGKPGFVRAFVHAAGPEVVAGNSNSRTDPVGQPPRVLSL